jgi:hypothetical protein
MYSDIYLNYLVGQILAVVSRQSVAKSLIHAFIDEDARLGACEEQFFGDVSSTRPAIAVAFTALPSPLWG